MTTTAPTAIRCGNRAAHGRDVVTHPSVADVRRCFSVVPAVPADGHYVLVGDDKLHFYRVRTPNEGRWTGRTFLDEQAGDQFFPVFGPKAASILSQIAVDPEAGPRYGRLIGRCYKCRKTLTDIVSIAAGAGPYCRGKA